MDTPNISISQVSLKLIAGIDEFKGTWKALNTIAPDQLNMLRRTATVESVGSSTRIEGAKLTDSEVEALLSGLHISSFSSRDEEEVAGYAGCMEMVFSHFNEIPADENHLKQMHQLLLKYSQKDIRHRGAYKTVSNNVEAFDEDGKSVGVIFETASPFDTPLLMEELMAWLYKEQVSQATHPLLVTAVFVVNFLAIHPFQDGNGRLSRILTTLLLLQQGYGYVPYCSLERIIEQNKDSYYLALRKAQQTIHTDNSSLNSWIDFFLSCLDQQIRLLQTQIEREELLPDTPPLSMDLLRLARERGRLTVRDAVAVTRANRNTVKSHIRKLTERGLLLKEGIGRGAWYRSS